MFSIISNLKSVAETTAGIAFMDDIDANSPSDFIAARNSLDARLVTLIRTIVSDPVRGLSTVPLCIVLDEAQYADGDIGLRRALLEILRVAGDEKWPIMFICLSWDAEWIANEVIPEEWSDASTPIPVEIIQLPMLFKSPSELGVSGVNFDVINLDRLAEIANIVRERLPGIDEIGVQVLQNRADGNPLVLNGLIDHALETPRLFMERNRSLNLTDEGLKHLKTVTFETAISQRFAEAPADVRAALGIGSHIGNSFSADLAIRTAAKLAWETSEEALEAAEKSFGFLQSVARRHYEFRQRHYRDVARGHMARAEDPAEIESARKETLNELLDEAIRGELELEKLPLQAIEYPYSQDDDVSVNQAAEWIWKVARIACKTFSRGDQTDIDTVAFYVTHPSLEWFDKVTWQTAPSNPGIRATLQNLVWIAKLMAASTLQDRLEEFGQKLLAYFSSKGWLNHRADTGEWREICLYIGDIFHQLRWYSGSMQTCADANKLAYHFINQADLSNRYAQQLKETIAATIVSALQRAGRLDEADRVYEEVSSDIIHQGESKSCHSVRMRLEGMLQRAERLNSVDQNEAKSAEILAKAKDLILTNLDTCPCHPSLLLAARIFSRMIIPSAKNILSDEPESLKDTAIKYLQQIDKDDNLDVLNTRAGIQRYWADALSFRGLETSNFELYFEEANKAILMQETLVEKAKSLKIKHISTFKINAATGRLQVARAVYFNQGYRAYLSYCQNALDELSEGFGLNSYDIFTSVTLFNNDIFFALLENDLDRAIKTAEEILPVLYASRKLIQHDRAQFRVIIMSYRYLAAFTAKYGETEQYEENSQLFERQCEKVFESPKSFLEWIGSLESKLGIDQEIVVEAVYNNKWPIRFQDKTFN